MLYTYIMPTKITARTNGPLLIEGDLERPERHGRCVFTGRPGVEDILIARAY